MVREKKGEVSSYSPSLKDREQKTHDHATISKYSEIECEMEVEKKSGSKETRVTQDFRSKRERTRVKKWKLASKKT